MPKGRLIVIDGTDGSGKATQADLLIRYLKKKKRLVKLYDFPQYDTFYGGMTGALLRGKYGPYHTISPYFFSVVVAADRAQVADQMHRELAAGYILICNRYVTSNLAHQTARVEGKKEQAAFMRWVKRMEYKENNMPKEDNLIFLHLPVVASEQLMKKKHSRKYLHGATHDQAETDLPHQDKSLAMYLKLAHEQKHWSVIRCTDKKNSIRSIDDIHREIIGALHL